MSYTECIKIINGLEYINRSTTRTICRPNGHPQHHTTSTRYIVQALVVSPTQPSPPHTHAHTTTHPPTAATSQHRSVPINNKYIRHVQFTFHSRPYNHPAIHVFIFIPSFACHTTTYIIQQKHKTKAQHDGLADFL